jgi:threonine dehydrogenase-like Zn-dependent dehydrogenase
MQALRYYPSVSRYLLANALGKRYPVGYLPLELCRLEPPRLPAGWQRVRVRLGGVCGSDLSLLYGKSSPRLSPFFSFPAVLGHEVLGEVEGVRVAVNPLLSCRERDLPACDACARGDDHLCLNLAEGVLAPGILGYCRDVPGGWGEEVVAHPARLYPIPGDVPDERAVLAEPCAVVLRGLKLAFWRPSGYAWPGQVLVIGAGSIGLIAVKLLRTLGFAGALHSVARYPQQAEMARALGADIVHTSTEEAARRIGAKAYPAIIGPEGRRGGFAAVIDAAGSASSLSEASWAVAEGGTLLLLGAPGQLRHDFSPYWFREVALVGSYVYTAGEFGEAVALLGEAEGLEALVTHQFALEDYREAIATLTRRRALKVVFRPGGTV